MKIRWIVLFIAALVIAAEIFLTSQGYENLSITSQIAKEVQEEKIVTKIIDGDTVVVEGGEKIRLLGIDCDERGYECYDEARLYIEEVLLGKKVVLEQDGEDKDMYGRSLRYIFLDGQNINTKMVAKGLCVARFEQKSKYQDEIKKAESNAISGKVGCKWEG